MNSYSQLQMVQQNYSGRDYDFPESTLGLEPTVRSEDLSGEVQGETSLNRQNQQVTLKPVTIFGRSKVTSSIVITMKFGIQLYVPKEETFPIPLKFVDVTRSTHTDLDVLQAKRIDHCWNVDSGRHLSDSWRGFTNSLH